MAIDNTVLINEFNSIKSDLADYIIEHGMDYIIESADRHVAVECWARLSTDLCYDILAVNVTLYADMLSKVNGLHIMLSNMGEYSLLSMWMDVKGDYDLSPWHS